MSVEQLLLLLGTCQQQHPPAQLGGGAGQWAVLGADGR